MNILFLAVDVDLKHDRGDAVHVRELARELGNGGHRVILVTGTSPNDAPQGIRHFTRPNSDPSQVLFGWELASGWADVIYERRTSPKLSWSISRLTGIPFVLEVNGVLADERRDSPGERTRWARPFKYWARRLMLKAASRIVAVSGGVRTDTFSTYGLPTNRIVVVSNGANLSEFHPQDRMSCRALLGLRPDDRILCFVGNLAPWQGVDLILGAMKRLILTDEHVRLILVGDGPEMGRLRSQAVAMNLTAFVRFEGNVPHAQVPKYISASDVCLAPFRQGRKASPIKVFEYMACARPIVLGGVDALGDFVLNSGAGLVVEPEDADAFATAVKRLLSNPSEAHAMGLNGRRAVESARSWEATARGVADVLSLVRAQASRKKDRSPRTSS